MMRTFLALVLLACVAPGVRAAGVCFPDAGAGVYLRLGETDVDVEIENQIAVVTTTQSFVNDLGAPFSLTYGFPLNESASATQLSWRIDDEWVDAIIEPADEADPIPGEDSMTPDLEAYLGATPLLFTCPECVVAPGDTFLVRLTYVELLPYAFGNVDLSYANDYTDLYGAPLDHLRLDVTLESPRTIDAFDLLSHDATAIDVGTNQASLTYESFGSLPSTDFHVQYGLSLDELGLFSMSSRFDPADIPDDHGGFFTFVAEPEPDAAVIEKVFTMIIDHSGSMLKEEKIEQALDAARFIVENLNEGDDFNIVDFGDSATAMASEHVPYTPENRDLALDYIDGIVALYLDKTNISSAFDLAVPQFSAATDSTANIIVFLTDGRPHGGIENTDSLLVHVHDLIVETQTRINLHTLGIGSNLNEQLLTLLASQNRGISKFLGTNEVEEVMTTFYQEIRNPVLIDTEISFLPDGIVTEVHPDEPPNLFIGSQMIISGRYGSASEVEVTLSGFAFGNPVAYTYDMPLADAPVAEYQFLPKVWAKAKIEELMIEYRSLPSDSAEAMAIRDEVIALSIAYGVVSPFTVFGNDDDDGTPIDEEEIDEGVTASIAAPYVLIGNRPNPFNPRTTIEFAVESDIERVVIVRIYDALGRLVRTLVVEVSGSGLYAVVWDGRSASGAELPSGAYLYAVDFGDAVLTGKMMLVK